MNSAGVELGGEAAVALYRTVAAANRTVLDAASDLHAVVRRIAGMVGCLLDQKR
jgi:hypothetical protein